MKSMDKTKQEEDNVRQCTTGGLHTARENAMTRNGKCQRLPRAEIMICDVPTMYRPKRRQHVHNGSTSL